MSFTEIRTKGFFKSEQSNSRLNHNFQLLLSRIEKVESANAVFSSRTDDIAKRLTELHNKSLGPEKLDFLCQRIDGLQQDHRGLAEQVKGLGQAWSKELEEKLQKSMQIKINDSRSALSKQWQVVNDKVNQCSVGLSTMRQDLGLHRIAMRETERGLLSMKDQIKDEFREIQARLERLSSQHQGVRKDICGLTDQNLHLLAEIESLKQKLSMVFNDLGGLKFKLELALGKQEDSNRVDVSMQMLDGLKTWVKDEFISTHDYKIVSKELARKMAEVVAVQKYIEEKLGTFAIPVASYSLDGIQSLRNIEQLTAEIEDRLNTMQRDLARDYESAASRILLLEEEAKKDRTREIKNSTDLLQLRLDQLSKTLKAEQQKRKKVSKSLDQLKTEINGSKIEEVRSSIKGVSNAVYQLQNVVQTKLATLAATDLVERVRQQLLAMVRVIQSRLREQLATKEGTKEGLVFLEQRLNDLVELVNQGFKQKKTLIGKKQIKCISCDQEVDSLIASQLKRARKV